MAHRTCRLTPSLDADLLIVQGTAPVDIADIRNVRAVGARGHASGDGDS